MRLLVFGIDKRALDNYTISPFVLQTNKLLSTRKNYVSANCISINFSYTTANIEQGSFAKTPFSTIPFSQVIVFFVGC